MDDGDYRKVFKLKKTLEEAITGCNEDTDCGCVHYSQNSTTYYYLCEGTETKDSESFGFEAWVSTSRSIFSCIYT